MHARFENRGTGLRDLTAAGREGTLTHQVRAQGGGRVEVGGPRVGLEWRGELTLSQPLAPGAAGWRTAHLNAQGDAQGALPPDVRGTVTGTVALQTATGPQEVSVDGQLRSSGTRVDATLATRGLGGTGDVRIATDGSIVRDLEARAQGLDVSPFAPGATGRVDAELRASGPLDALGGSGSVRGAGLVWNGVAIGSAAVDLTGSRGRGTARMAVPSLNVTGDATFDAREATARLELAQTPLAPLQPLMPAGRPLEGAVTASADVRVPWSDPMRAR